VKLQRRSSSSHSHRRSGKYRRINENTKKGEIFSEKSYCENQKDRGSNRRRILSKESKVKSNKALVTEKDYFVVSNPEVA